MVKSVEGGVDGIDELIGSLAMLKAAVNSVLVHLGDEVFKLVTVQKSVAIDIACDESLIDLSLETLSGSGIRSELLLESGALGGFLSGEGGLPRDLVYDKRHEKGLNSLLFAVGFNHC